MRLLIGPATTAQSAAHTQRAARTNRLSGGSMRPESKITLSGPNGNVSLTDWRAQYGQYLTDVQGDYGPIGRLGTANDNRPPANDNRRKKHTQTPFERMCDRGELDSEASISEVIYAAGKRYYSDWYLSGLSGLSAIDYSRVGGGGETSPAHYTPVSERQAERRAAHRAARVALGDEYAKFVEPIVLEDATAGELRHLAPMLDKTRASKWVMQELREGMRRLAKHYDQCDAKSLLDATQRGGNSWMLDLDKMQNDGCSRAKSHARYGEAAG
jgi:hypothetical protein